MAELDWPFAHEAGVYIPSTEEIYITSNILTTDQKQHIRISKIDLKKVDSQGHYEITHLDEATRAIPMGNGGTNYKGSILFCSQGDHDTPSSLSTLSVDGKVECILNNYHGRPYNSLNDVVVHPDGSIWFTDPSYGSEQGFKPAPQLPNQVYCFDPSTGHTRIVADGFEKPNGIAFSPDWKTCYITDTSLIEGTGKVDPTRKGHIYAFDVLERDETLYLINRRVFAYVDCGAPDGIKCDTKGNVYSGCFDGVHIWDQSGWLIGKILLPSGFGCANLVFGPKGTLFVLAETRIYRVTLNAETALPIDKKPWAA